jgi:hypothetical protein
MTIKDSRLVAHLKARPFKGLHDLTFSAACKDAPFKTARQSDEMPSYEMGLLLTMGPGFTTIRP